MAGQRITKRVVDGLRPKPQEYTKWGRNLTGFRCPGAAKRSQVLRRGIQAGSGRAVPKKRLTIGAVGKSRWKQARALAQSILGKVAHGRDPAKERRKAEASAGNTLRGVAENYLAREGGQLRTVDVRRATLERLVYPALGARQIDDIKRSDINKLLDKIEDERGARTATLTLALLASDL